jgi:hypothetical protein
MMLLIVLVNVAVAAVSGVSCLVGMARPKLFLPAGEQLTPGSAFLAGAYAARALPLSVVTVGVLCTGNVAAIAPVLIVAGLAQVGDAILGARRHNAAMVAVCIGLAAVHLATAGWLLQR